MPTEKRSPDLPVLPRRLHSLDSMEGLPEAFEAKVVPAPHGLWSKGGHDLLNRIGGLLPGIGLGLVLAFLGYQLSGGIGRVLHYDKSPISPILVAVLLGLLLRNTVGVPRVYETGLGVCLKGVLRLGIVLLGLRLSVQAVAEIGLTALPIIACCIATALIAVTVINRALGLPRRLGTLIAVGTSICGVSAIVATAPVILADEDETSYAVACITLFGLLALFTYPWAAHLLFTSPTQVGLFLGTSIHDTSQVAGAGLAYAQQFAAKSAMDTAVVVKLVRNLSMSVLIPLMAVLYHRSDRAGTPGVRQKWHQMVPLFVVGFVGMACLRSLGDIGAAAGADAFGLVDRQLWEQFCHTIGRLAPWFLATAMAAVGLGTDMKKLRGLGWKPFTVGFTAALLVGGVSTVLIRFLIS